MDTKVAELAEAVDTTTAKFAEELGNDVGYLLGFVRPEKDYLVGSINLTGRVQFGVYDDDMGEGSCVDGPVSVIIDKRLNMHVSMLLLQQLMDELQRVVDRGGLLPFCPVGEDNPF